MNPTDMLAVGQESQRLAKILAQLQNFKGVTLPKVEGEQPSPMAGKNVYYALNQHGQYELSPLFVEKIVCALLSGGNTLETLAKSQEQPSAAG